MKNRILNFIVNFALFSLIIISCLGIIDNLTASLWSSSKIGLLLIDILFLLLFILIYNYSQIVKNIYKVKCYYTKLKKQIIFIIVVLTIAWQIYLIFTLSGFSLWDPGNIILQAMNKNQWGGKEYFSYYPNTYFLMLIEHWLWIILGHPSLKVLTYVMNTINYVFIDFSLPVLYKVGVTVVNKTCGRVALVLGFIGVGLSPWGCLTYSDTLAFSLSIFTMYILINLHNFANKYVTYCMLGVLFSVDYLIKPSIIIVFIAFAFFAPIKSINGRKLISILVFLMTVFLTLGGFSIYKSRNNFVRIDSSKSFSMMHFAEMGIEGSGGYSNKDALRDMIITNPKKRNEIARKAWVKEFNNKGVIGYQKFLMKKQIANTADPSFAWGKDGIPFIKPFNKGKGIDISRHLFMQNGEMRYNNSLMTVCEIVWLGVLLLVLISIIDNQVARIKLTVVGFFLFLLIFEGGRSRYMLQFLPYILVLAGTGFSLLTKEIIHTVKDSYEM